MPSSHTPEEFLPQGREPLPNLGAPDLALRDLNPERNLTKDTLMEIEVNDDKPDQQSVFSKRSGIQDPLLRPDARGDEKGEARPEGESEASLSESQNPAETQEPESPPAERKRRKIRGQPRLVKSRHHLDRARR